MTPPSSAHVQLDDDPRTPIQQGVGDEFRQHDGVVTMMMFYRRRASPKHCNDMTEVEYGGRGHRTRLRNDHEDQLVCPRVPLAPVYKGVEEGEGRPSLWRALGGVLLPPGVGFPPFLVEVGALPSRSRRGRKEERGRKERGASPPPNSDWAWGGAPPSLAPSLFLLHGPNKAHIPPGGFR